MNQNMTDKHNRLDYDTYIAVAKDRTRMIQLTFSFFALQLTIHISDENDNAPVFTQGIYTATIPENVPQGHSVIRVNTSDADIGINAEHSFTITGIAIWVYLICIFLICR